jgi:GTP-binding protein
MTSRAVSNLRNVAIVAHVDHGKTTLVDAMLRQSGAMRQGSAADVDRIMDSMDLEREKGITILAKNTAVRWPSDDGTEVKLNVVDTPGHADFGGEVERALTMVDGILLLVDSSEGPLPQTRFVLRKALERDLPVVVAVNKIDRPDARIPEVLDEIGSLFLDLAHHDHHLDFPTVYCNARAGTATLDLATPGEDLRPLFETLVEHIPAPQYDPDEPFAALVTNLDASPYLGRLALCRIQSGYVKRTQSVAWCRLDGRVENVKLSALYVTENHLRVEADEAGPGEIIAVAGLSDVTIGETLADPIDPRPLPPVTVDEPSLSMTIGINTSPLAGRAGGKLTARLVKGRLDAELIGNVSLRVLPTERPDQWEVQGRGELQLAVLVEIMRREGFELTVGKPQVLTRLIDDTLHEPIEHVSIDVPEEHLGTITQLLSVRKGRMEQVLPQGPGWLRMEWRVPARGLIGLRTEFMTETRGTGVIHHVFDGWAPWAGEIRTRPSGSVVADRLGVATGYAIEQVQERATMFIAPGAEVYEGMIVGENARAEDMDVNICREKKVTNIRASSAEEFVKLVPPKAMTLEQALEFIGDDECVEVTAAAVRLRKVALVATDRARQRKQLRAPRA